MQSIPVKLVKDKIFNIRLNSKLMERIKERAGKEDALLNDYINQLLLNHLVTAGENIEFESGEILKKIMEEK